MNLGSMSLGFRYSYKVKAVCHMPYSLLPLLIRQYKPRTRLHGKGHMIWPKNYQGIGQYNTISNEASRFLLFKSLSLEANKYFLYPRCLVRLLGNSLEEFGVRGSARRSTIIMRIVVDSHMRITNNNF